MCLKRDAVTNRHFGFVIVKSLSYFSSGLAARKESS